MPHDDGHGHDLFSFSPVVSNVMVSIVIKKERARPVHAPLSPLQDTLRKQMSRE